MMNIYISHDESDRQNRLPLKDKALLVVRLMHVTLCLSLYGKFLVVVNT